MAISQTVLPTPPQLEARNTSWTRYWSSGVLHSCPGSFSGNYDGAIAAFWKEAFVPLTAGRRVLDVATGNGALPRMLLGFDGWGDSGCHVDAIDLAQLAPDWVSGLDADRRGRLRLHSGVMAEHLPFAAAGFDLVVSQYGIEYAALEQALAEAARVLKPGGRLCLLMHHADSVPVRRGAIEVAQAESLLAARGLIDTASRMLPWLALAASAEGRARLQGNAAANADRDLFNRAQQQLQNAIDAAAAEADLLFEARDQVQGVLAMVAAHGVEAAQAALRALRQMYEEHLLRARELCAHALDAERLREVLRQLDALGFALASARPLHYQSHLMGWALSAERS
jgi:SAM-dependent methyltransferase